MHMDVLEKSYRALQSEVGTVAPTLGMVLGSGWGSVSDLFEMSGSVAYSSLPGWGEAGVKGHGGVVHVAHRAGLCVLLFQGRRHWYEGAGWEPVAMPVYLTRRFGAASLLLTNAAGGIRADLNPGDFMIVEDHINAMGASPLIGPHQDFWGPRFPDMTRVYDRELIRLLQEAGSRLELPMASGIYAAVAGPVYETPAEIAALRGMGADAVGMSTVPEASLAHAAGLRVAAVSCIANRAAGLGPRRLSHEQVVADTSASASRLRALLSDLLDHWPRDTHAPP